MYSGNIFIAFGLIDVFTFRESCNGIQIIAHFEI